MRVVGDRLRVAEVGCRRRAQGVLALGALAFSRRPAVVRPVDPQVDLFTSVLADVVDVEAGTARVGVEREAPRVAQAVGEDLLTDGDRRRRSVAARGAPIGTRAGERVPRRRRAGPAVDPQDLAVQQAQVLRGVVAAGAAAVATRVAATVADGHVQVPVVAHFQVAAVVVAGRRTDVVEQHQFRGSLDGVAVHAEPAHAVHATAGRRRVRPGVVEVHVAIGVELRVERHAQQAALTLRAHGEIECRSGEQRTVLQDAHGPALLQHDHAPIGHCRHRGGSGEATDDERVGEAGDDGALRAGARRSRCRQRGPDRTSDNGTHGQGTHGNDTTQSNDGQTTHEQPPEIFQRARVEAHPSHRPARAGVERRSRPTALREVAPLAFTPR